MELKIILSKIISHSLLSPNSI